MGTTQSQEKPLSKEGGGITSAQGQKKVQAAIPENDDFYSNDPKMVSAIYSSPLYFNGTFSSQKSNVCPVFEYFN